MPFRRASRAGEAHGLFRHRETGDVILFTSNHNGYMIYSPHNTYAPATKIHDMPHHEEYNWEEITRRNPVMGDPKVIGNQYQCTLVPFFVGQIDFELVDLWLNSDIKLHESIIVAEPYRAYAPADFKRIVNETVSRALELVPMG